MTNDQLSNIARAAVQKQDWRSAADAAAQILHADPRSAEGHFLSGLVAKRAAQPEPAEQSLKRALKLDNSRYDAAIELADVYVRSTRHDAALEILKKYESMLSNSPMYLHMAAAAYSRLDLHNHAWPLYKKACSLQPGIEQFRADLAACSVYVGKISEARRLYKSLLNEKPEHQRYHYQLSQAQTARNPKHVEQMKSIVSSNGLPPSKNIFLYYAIGKELEDLEAWEEAFRYYEIAGNAVKSVSPYIIQSDLDLVNTVIDTCNMRWLDVPDAKSFSHADSPIPIFVVGLPRTGTTLTERILSSHREVGSVGETFFIPLAIRQQSSIATTDTMSPSIIRSAASQPAADLAARYWSMVGYKLGNERLFVEKLPENYLYLGFIARAFPQARIVHLRRHPMDACFAMFKQSFFRYAYTLDDVGRYYVAYDKLMQHWRAMLGNRLVDVHYENLVNGPEAETRRLLQRLGLQFDEACLKVEENAAPSATASAVQVREKIHTRSIDRWRHFERQLEPLKSYLRSNRIEI